MAPGMADLDEPRALLDGRRADRPGRAGRQEPAPGPPPARRPPHRLIALALAILLVLLAGAGWWWWSSSATPGSPEWQGYAEADFVKVGPTQPGALTAVRVARGDRVAQGLPLFDQDDTADRDARDQAARQLAQSEEQLKNLQSPAKPTELQQAAANLMDAEAARDKIQSDLQRSETLLRTGNATAQTVDQQRADLRSATAKVAGLQAMLSQMRAPMGRPGEIAAQAAAVEAARAAQGMIQWRLDQRHVAAPVDAIVADVLARPGETMAAGAPVVSLLPPGNIFVRFFVPEPALATVHLGERVALLCDGCAAGLGATVSFISPQAEYTPPIIYSEASRSKLVFMVEARPSREHRVLLNPGQPVMVRPVPTESPR